MGVLLDPVCGDQGQQDRFLGLCLGAESVEACREFLLLSKRDLELVLTVLHLAKVYGLILAVDQKFDLLTTVTPTMSESEVNRNKIILFGEGVGGEGLPDLFVTQEV